MDLSSYKELWGEIKKYFTLQIDYVKLTALEKLTIILSAMAFVGVVLVLSACILFYLSSALVALISTWIDCIWGANLIVGGVILILLLVVISLKKRLIIDPVAKFITKLFMNPPQE